MSNWQPIETAPKDGRSVLLWFPDFSKQVVAYWERVYGDWVEPVSGECLLMYYDCCTHWQPLLPAPEDKMTQLMFCNRLSPDVEAFAWLPVRTTHEGWIWLRSYTWCWVAVKHYLPHAEDVWKFKGVRIKLN